MILSIEKKSLSENHEAFGFGEIEESVAAQGLEAYSAAKLIFGPQLLCFDADSKNMMQENALAQKKKLRVKSVLQQRYEAGIRRNRPFSFSDAATVLDPASILDDDIFSMDGSIVMNPSYFKANAPLFFEKSRRVGVFRQAIHLRGGRYTISANPTFELRQKLLTFEQDFNDGLDSIGGGCDYLFRLGIADYIKNAVITMFNSLVYQEKTGWYHFDKPSYQALRREGQQLAQASVELFYGTMGRMPTLTAHAKLFLDENRSTFVKLQAYILDQYKEGVFSSRHLTRPEASHPLVIAAAAIRTARRAKVPDLIVGLPAGSTELALVQATAFRVFKRKQVQVLLSPVSLHSIKHDFDHPPSDHNAVHRFFRSRDKQISGKTVLVVDDNSSTGRTVQIVTDALSARGAKFHDGPSIAESDIVRSKLDMKNSERNFIADRSCYSQSVNILPVSRNIAPKADLRQILESKKMVTCVKERYFQPTSSLRRQIVGNVYVDLISNPTEKVLSKIEDTQKISSFRKTFLSNFQEVSINYLGEAYLSVEHAYQAMKFSDNSLSSVTQQHIDIINKKLVARDVSIISEDLPRLFTDTSFSAGTSKIVANQLRILGYVRTDWDYVKADIMCQMLIQKFSHPDLFGLLQKTDQKYLVEGNDWGDTYWGFSGGRGRNALGRMLMEVRKIGRDTLLAASINDRERIEYGPS